MDTVENTVESFCYSYLTVNNFVEKRKPESPIDSGKNKDYESANSVHSSINISSFSFASSLLFVISRTFS